MRKYLLLILAVILASGAMLGSASAHEARRALNANWLQFRVDSQRSGFNPYETQITPANVSQLRLSKIVGFPFDLSVGQFSRPGAGSLVIFNRKIYLSATSFDDPDSDGFNTAATTYALSATTGAISWTHSDACGVPVGAPAISTISYTLVVPKTVGCGSQSGGANTLGLSAATGSLRWTRDINDASSPAIVGGTAFLAEGQPGVSSMSSINTSTGEPNWSTDGNFRAPAVSFGVVYAREFVDAFPAPSVARVTALSANTGARLWTTTTGTATGDPTVAGSRIYVLCDQGLCSYDNRGKFKWSYAGADGQMAVANGKIYVGCNVVDVCALNATTGALAWTFVGSDQVFSATVAGGIVYVGTAGQSIMLDVSNGTHLRSIGPTGVRDPVILNGMVYFESANRLYIYRLT